MKMKADNQIKIKNSLLLPLLEESFKNNESVLLTVVGFSMFPYLVGNIDKVTLNPCLAYNLKIGDVILFKVADEFILHRIIEIFPDTETIITKGDNSIRNEKLNFKDVLAVAKKSKLSSSESFKRFYSILKINLKKTILKIVIRIKRTFTF